MRTDTKTHFLNPTDVVVAAGIASGDRVADFGCAAGYFSLPCARIVGQDGKVIAIDLLPQALNTVQSKAQLEGLHIETRRTNLEKERGSGLEDESMDWVILKNVLFMSTDREAMLSEAYRVVQQGGHALIVEWNDVQRGIGPKESERIPLNAMKELVVAAGFRIDGELQVGSYHYGMIAKK